MTEDALRALKEENERLRDQNLRWALWCAELQDTLREHDLLETKQADTP